MNQFKNTECTCYACNQTFKGLKYYENDLWGGFYFRCPHCERLQNCDVSTKTHKGLIQELWDDIDMGKEIKGKKLES